MTYISSNIPLPAMPRSSLPLEIVHVDLWGKHRAESYGGYQSLAVFTDDMSRIRCVALMKTKHEAAEALRQVADPGGIGTRNT